MRVVTVAHGTRHGAGNRVAADIARGVGERLELTAQATYVELCEPLFADVVRASDEPTIAVPLLLSTGYHVAVDLPRAVSGAAGAVTLAPALGPHPLLAQAQAARLIESGAVPGTPVAMVAAGSRDTDAGHDLAAAASLLSQVWGAPVTLAVLSGDGARPADVIRPGDAVSLYLLAPGHFADRARRECLAAGAVYVADVIGAHELVVELAVERATADTRTRSMSG